jgi:hypothetical protein
MSERLPENRTHTQGVHTTPVTMRQIFMFPILSLIPRDPFTKNEEVMPGLPLMA